METRNPGYSLREPPRRFRPRFLVFHPTILFFAMALGLAGCASPGQPTARTPPVPQRVSDLAASQSGNDAVLTFTIPQETNAGRSLEQPPAIQIYRDFEPLPAASESQPPPKHPTLLVTIPAEMVAHYSVRQSFRYTEALQATDFTDHPGTAEVFSVRTYVDRKKLSPSSNSAALRVYPAADPIDDLRGVVTPTGVALAWTPPQRTPVGPVPQIAGYRIYRAEERPNGAFPSASEAAPAAPPAAAAASPSPRESVPTAVAPPAPQTPLVKIGESASPEFRDAQAEFGKTYVYSVRSVLDNSGAAVESADSNFLVITRRDTFPPAAPRGLVAAFVPAQGGVPAHFDLSWNISPETDLAGYHVYRSEQADVLGTRLDNDLLLTPAFRDMNVVSGHRYYYAVTAVDRSGNESEPSASVSVMMPAVTQPTP
jgi:hypothetical protein